MRFLSFAILASVFVFASNGKASYGDLTEAEQKKARENYERYNSMSSSQKEEIIGNWKHYQSLSSDQKKRLEQKYSRLGGLSKERKSWALNRGKARASVSNKNKSIRRPGNQSQKKRKKLKA